MRVSLVSLILYVTTHIHRLWDIIQGHTRKEYLMVKVGL